MILAIDTETELITQAEPVPRLVCVSYWSAEGGGGLAHATDARALVEEVLRTDDLTIVGQNIAYDVSVLMRAFPEQIPLWWSAYEADRITDTAIRQKLIDIAEGTRRAHDAEAKRTKRGAYSLESLALRLLGRQLDKTTWRLRYGELIDTTLADWPESARVYPIEDARASFEVHAAQEANNALFLRNQYEQTRAAWWLRLCSVAGICTSAEAIAQLEADTHARYDVYVTELTRAGLLRAPRTVHHRTGEDEDLPGSRDTRIAKEIMRAACAAQGREPTLTDSGEVCLDEVACIGSEDPRLVMYAKYSGCSTIINKDIPALLEGVTYPLHTRFEELLETGRTSSSKPNIQNLRRAPGVRECFVPRAAGYVFLSADYHLLELCTLAQVCTTWLGHSALKAALNAGEDPHLRMAARILGIDYAEAQARKAAGDHAVADARGVGKVANFGFPGGLGAGTFVDYALASYGVVISKAKAGELKSLWLAEWPEMREYFRRIDARANADPGIEQLSSGRYRQGSYCELANTMFQGLGADIAKAAGWKIARQQCLGGGPLDGTVMANFVHDEFILEVPEEHLHDCAEELKRIMVEAARPYLPDVTISAEAVGMHRWSKKAKPIYTRGRLVPWTP